MWEDVEKLRKGFEKKGPYYKVIEQTPIGKKFTDYYVHWLEALVLRKKEKEEE